MRCHRLAGPTSSLLFALCLAFAAGCGDDVADDRFGPPPPTDRPTRTATPVPSATPTATAALTSAEVLQRGPFAVGVTTLQLEDTSRPTNPNRTFPGSPSRQLVTEVWYPASGDRAQDEIVDAPLDAGGAPYPFVFHSHGFLSNRREGGYIARHLASHGYVVAAVDFPLSNGGAPGGATILDIHNQPGDIGFVIDSFLEMSAASGNRFSGTIDADRIALSGLSLGGGTTLLATFSSTLRDPRVRAAAALSPAFTCFFSQPFYSVSVPLLIVHGDIDAILPYDTATYAFSQAQEPKYLVTLVGGSHTAFSDVFGSPATDALHNPDDIGCRALGMVDPFPAPQPGQPNLFDLLGGAEGGIVLRDCPLPCTGPMPLPPALKGRRQHALTIASVFPFFEAELRGRDDMRAFLEQRLAVENAEIGVELER